MSETMKKPRIRFKGFTEAWEQRKLNEIADKVTEKNAGLQYIETFTNSAEFGIVSQRDFFDHDIAKMSSLGGYYIVRNEDFVYNPRISTSAPVGPINRNKLGRIGVMSPLYTVFRPHDVDTTYLEYFFKSKYWHSFMNFNGDSGARSDRFSIKDSVFFEMPIPLPYIEEQRKIGEHLTQLDRLITLHQRKYDKLLNIKKSMLEKMFPKNGNDVPEIRFKGFTDAWEQRKLGEVVEIKDSARIPNTEWTESGVPYIRASDITNEDMNGVLFISRERYEFYKNRTGSPAQGDVLFNGGGEIGKTMLNTDNEPIYVQGGAVLYARTSVSKVLNGQYLKVYFETPSAKNYIGAASAGGTMKHFTLKPSQEMPIKISTMQEQQKIGDYFSNLDNLITLHQRKLEKLKNIKKSMLEKMFV